MITDWYRDRRVVSLLGVLAVLLVFLLAAPMFIATNALTDAIDRWLGDLTQREVTHGVAKISLLPTPRIAIDNLKIANLPGAPSESLLSIERVVLHLGFLSAFTDVLQIEEMEVQNPLLDLQMLADNTPNWPAGLGLNAERVARAIPASLEEVRIRNFKIHYANLTDRMEKRIEPIDLDMHFHRFGEVASLAGTVGYNDVTLALSGKLGATAGKGYYPLTLALSKDASSVALRGNVGRVADRFAISGYLDVAIDDLTPWFKVFEWVDKKMLEQSMPAGPVPFTLSSIVEKSADALNFKAIKIGGGNTDGEGDIRIQLGDIVQVTADGKFKKFGLEEWAHLFSPPRKPVEAVPPEDPNAIPADYADVIKKRQEEEDRKFEESQKPKIDRQALQLPRNLSATISLAMDTVIFKGWSVKDANIAAQMDDGEIVVTQAFASLAGDTQAVCTGIVKPGKDGPTFEGSVELAGKSFQAWVKDVTADALPLPDTGYGAFRSATNLYLSPREARLSEAKLQVEKNLFAGAVTLVLGDMLAINSAVGARNLDLDGLYETWSGRYRALHPPPPIVKGEEGEDRPNEFDFSWLKAFPHDLKLKLRIDNFLLHKETGSSVSADIALKDKKLSMKDIDYSYGDTQATGAFLLDARDEYPFIDTDLVLNRFDTALLLGKDTDENVKTPAGAPWPEKQLHYPYFNDFNANLKFAIADLAHGGQHFTNTTLNGALRDTILALQSFHAEAFGGIVDITGNIGGGTVPGASIKYALQSVSLERLLPLLLRVDNITGVASINGSIGMSGISYKNWVASALGNMYISGQNVGVNKFDLSVLIRAVAGVRAVSDIVNVARLAYPAGRTEFPSVEGSLTVERGVASIGGIRLASDQTQAMLSGRVDLNARSNDLVANFPLITVTKDAPPSLRVTVKGPWDALNIALDTKELESYVARIAAERMLDRKKPEAPQ